MADERAPALPRPKRRLRIVTAGVLVAWFSVGAWNSLKPPPPGTHVTSLTNRLAEAQVEFLYDSATQKTILAREIAAVDRAEQLIVMDQCPLPRELAQHLLARRQLRPKLKIVLVTDPKNEIYGGTPAHYFTTLEKAGVIVSRVRLDRLRDSNPVYSGLWRLGVGWWSNPYDEAPGKSTLAAWLRHANGKADERQLLVADDGAGGWTSLVLSASPSQVGGDGENGAGLVALELRGRIARDLVASELTIADWSTADDRLPGAPSIESRGVGSIDARFLTEGAIHGALLDAIGNSTSGDELEIAAQALGDRRLIGALARAAGRLVRVHILLQPAIPANRVVAAELLRRGSGRIELRWLPAPPHDPRIRFVILRHAGDLWLNVGSADYTRRGLDDFNLAANVELRMPARVGAARAATDYFAALWATGTPVARHLDDSENAYWQYRFAEATGLMSN